MEVLADAIEDRRRWADRGTETSGEAEDIEVNDARLGVKTTGLAWLGYNTGLRTSSEDDR